MKKEEVVELFAIAKKAADDANIKGILFSAAEVSRCVEVLNRLKGIPITDDVLASTNILKGLQNLTKHKNQKIRSMASCLLQIWNKRLSGKATSNNKCAVMAEHKMEREVAQLFEAARKAAHAANDTGVFSSAAEVSRCINALNRLKGLPITLKAIGKVGKGLQDLIEDEHTNEKIRSMASCLLDAWKRRLYATCRHKSNTCSVMVETHKDDPVKSDSFHKSAVKSKEASRGKVRQILVEALSKVTDEVREEMKKQVLACDPVSVARSVESVMFAKLGSSFNGAEKVKYRRILFNIRNTNNPDLRRKVLLGEVKAERLITMTPEELASNQMQLKINQIKERALQREH